MVLFSILMGMKDKEALLQALSTASQALIRMTNLIVKLTPVGVFAITAAAAGTMTIEEFGRLQVYLVSFNIAALFLTFWVLPMMVTPLTPFKYRDIIGLTRDALVTAFTTGNMPFTYISETGELIGFDVDMAQLLAREMNVKLEFIPFDYEKMTEQLDAGLFDVVMSGVAITTQRLENMVFTDSYMEATLCFIVPDHRRAEFATREAVHGIPELKIGIPHASDYFFPKLKAYLPRARVTDDLRSC